MRDIKEAHEQNKMLGKHQHSYDLFIYFPVYLWQEEVEEYLM